jgi:NADPH2:quinone reductase
MTGQPAQMTAIEISEGGGGPDVLRPVEVAVPVPGPGQMLVEVRAAGVNRPDVLQRKGAYPAPKGHSPIPGLEVGGYVVALGEGVARWRIGDAVMALVNGGGYASHCLVEEGQALPVPPRLTIVEAAGVPETFFTVWHNLIERGRMVAGEWVMIHGGSSGIGVTAIQIARALGANVIATAGSAAKCEACRSLGADRAVNYRDEDFVAVAKDVTGGRGVDVTLDMVGGDYVQRNISAAAEDGRIVNIAFQTGGTVTVDLQRAMLKRLAWTGSTLRARTTAVKSSIARGLEQTILPMLADGRIHVPVDSTFPLREAGAAHARMEGGEHIGKIVLVV